MTQKQPKEYKTPGGVTVRGNDIVLFGNPPIWTEDVHYIVFGTDHYPATLPRDEIGRMIMNHFDNAHDRSVSKDDYKEAVDAVAVFIGGIRNSYTRILHLYTSDGGVCGACEDIKNRIIERQKRRDANKPRLA